MFITKLIHWSFSCYLRFESCDKLCYFQVLRYLRYFLLILVTSQCRGVQTKLHMYIVEEYFANQRSIAAGQRKFGQQFGNQKAISQIIFCAVTIF